MPHLRFRGMTEEHVAELSHSLPKELAATIQTTEDNFSFEFIHTQFYSQGQRGGGYPFVEVLWFQRSQEIQNDSAKIITEKIKKLDPKNDVVVVFVPLPQNAYYENSVHF